MERGPHRRPQHSRVTTPARLTKCRTAASSPGRTTSPVPLHSGNDHHGHGQHQTPGRSTFGSARSRPTGNVVERAGLVRTGAGGVGDLYVIKVNGLTPDGVRSDQRGPATSLSTAPSRLATRGGRFWPDARRPGKPQRFQGGHTVPPPRGWAVGSPEPQRLLLRHDRPLRPGQGRRGDTDRPQPALSPAVHGHHSSRAWRHDRVHAEWVRKTSNMFDNMTIESTGRSSLPAGGRRRPGAQRQDLDVRHHYRNELIQIASATWARKIR